MTAPVQIWLETSHHAAFRVGGWAFVRRDAAGVTGQAGGERRISAERTALMSLVAALAEAGTGPVRLQTGSPLVAAVPGRIRAAEAGEDPPAEDLDLWAQAMRALAARPVEIAPAAVSARPTAFVAAWAELGRDRAKDKGNFVSAIPKPNLAKAGAG